MTHRHLDPSSIRRASAAGLLGCLLASRALAGPALDATTEDKLPASAKGAAETLRAADAPAVSNTVKTLLELQGSQPVVETGMRVPRTRNAPAEPPPAEAAVVPTTPVAAVAAPPAAPPARRIDFINPNARSPSADRVEGAERSSLRSEQGGGGNARAAAQRAAQEEPEEETAVWRWIRKLRENREVVFLVGLVALVVGGWSAATSWGRR